MLLSRILPVVLVLFSLALSGCVQFKARRGIEVAWQDQIVSKLEKGQTTRSDVLALMGPPSQVIALENETVLYYLFEKAEGDGLILIVYNSIDIGTRYDRAIFFFDENDRLTDFSTKVHAHDG
ncbi:MAG: outer membrane protein assembly factor BamE [Chromatiaceae bacterium]|jgi:outer membrane protein assembly factor BamE (lipoprotein component of BamABCDE complex)